MKKIEDFREIVKLAPNLFREKIERINNGIVHMFNYSKEGVTYDDFLKYDAFDMRGITFVTDDSGDHVFPMLKKFFNYGEVKSDIVGGTVKYIKYIQEKFDGSLLGFIIVNDKVFAKTKTGLSNEFTEIGNKWIRGQENKIKDLYSLGFCPLFEVISNKHKIVVEYDEESLKLLQIVDIHGNLMDLKGVEEISKKYGWDFVPPINKTFKEILQEKSDVQGKEGYIITYTDGSLTKVKTDWYFEAHVMGEGTLRTNELLELMFGAALTDDILDYEKIFLENIVDIITKNQITSIYELKGFLFKTGSASDVELYKKNYRDFLREYALDKNIKNENSQIKHILLGTLDDFLPNLNEIDRVTVERNRDLVMNYFYKTVNNILKFQRAEKGSDEFKSIQKSNINGKDLYLKAYFKNLKKEEIENELKKAILHQNRKKDAARTFIKNLKDKYV